MSQNEKPLPRPKDTPFGQKRRFEEDAGDESLLADELAMAASQGRLDEFMQNRMPDNEYAKSLTMMMMGMTGMLPPEGSKSTLDADKEKDPMSSAMAQPDTKNAVPAEELPEDVVKAVQSGDVNGLMEMLEREHKKRMNDSGPSVRSEDPAPYGVQPNIEKEILDQLIKIASGNNVTLDWIVLRALKLYVQEYLKTSRL